MEEDADHRRDGEADLLFSVYRRQAGSSQEPAARGPPGVLRAAVPGILAAYDVEFVQRIHQRLQEARSAQSSHRPNNHVAIRRGRQQAHEPSD